MHCLEATIIHDSLLESRGGGVAGMTTLGRCSWAAREKESHGLLPLYVALATKVPCAPGSCPPSISASPLSLARAAQTEAERVDWIHPGGVGCVCVGRRFGLGGERRAFPRQRETSLECRSSAKPRCWCSEASTCDVFKAARYPTTESFSGSGPVPPIFQTHMCFHGKDKWREAQPVLLCFIRLFFLEA